MKYWMLLMIGWAACGCAQQKPPQSACATRYYQSSPALALAIDPPATAGEVALDLDRSERSPGAFYGYEQATTNFYWLRQDDEQIIDGGRFGNVDRRAISGRAGFSSR